MIDRQIRCGTICTDWYHTSSYFASLANASGGFSATCTSAKNSIIDYICLKNMNYTYNIITSTGLKSVALEKELSYRYWTDSDGDGISDYDECVWDGVDERYRNVGPLHKDTIETLFPEISNRTVNTNISPVFITITDNKVVLHMQTAFSDSADDDATKWMKTTGLKWWNQSECNNILARISGEVTFKNLIKDAISTRWTDVYQGTQYDFYNNIQVDFSVDVIEIKDERLQNKVKINILPGVCGVPVSYIGEWELYGNKPVMLYTGYCSNKLHAYQGGGGCSEYMNSQFDIAVFEGICAHELGHVWGVADIYASASSNHGFEPISNVEIPYILSKYGLSDGYGLMICNGSAVANDVEMVMQAFSEMEFQYFVPYGAKQKLSKAIKCGVEYRKKSEPNKIYLWNENINSMELKSP